ncbi:hypothetical protein O6H91_02G052000 [Diphasiastrum complanatum]|nr:hypothetical protein O6H91_02G052000 [Diphasiastrum complanatum]
MSGVRDDDVGFSRGWKEFSTDHNLKTGDLLVFSMIAESRFLVQHFDETGCEKTAKFRTESFMSTFTGDDVLRNKRTRMQALLTKEFTASKRIFHQLPEAETGEMCLKHVKTEDLNPESKEGQKWCQDQLKLRVKQEVETEAPTPESKEGKTCCQDQFKYRVKKEVETEALTPKGKEGKKGCQDQLKFKVKQEVETEASPPEREEGQKCSPDHLNFRVKQEVGPTPDSKEGNKSSQDQLKFVVKHEVVVEEAGNTSKQQTSAFTRPKSEKLIDDDTMPSNSNKVSAVVPVLNTEHEETENIEGQRQHQKQKSKLPRINRQKYISACYISQRRPVTKLERERTLQAAQSFKSTNPFVVLVIKPSHVYRGFWLALPVKFCRKWLPPANASITLTDPDGLNWQANWLGNPNRCGAGISGGWRRFALDHGLEEGDVCIFELTNREQIVLKVHIFRIVEPINGPNGLHGEEEHPAQASKASNKSCNKGNRKFISMEKATTQKPRSISEVVNNPPRSAPDLEVKSYKVERLFGRRNLKTSKETEYLVSLENTNEIQEIKNFEREREGVWWVRLSHFTEDFLTCHS